MKATSPAQAILAAELWPQQALQKYAGKGANPDSVMKPRGTFLWEMFLPRSSSPQRALLSRGSSWVTQRTLITTHLQPPVRETTAAGTL